MTVAEEIDMGAAATLIVAWRSGRNAHGGMLKAGGPVISALRSYGEQSLAKISGGHGRPYNPDDEQEDDQFLSAGKDELLDTALLEQLQIGSSLPLVSPDDVRHRSLALYALIVGDDPASCTTFIRRSNPVSLTSKGVIAIFDQTLTRVTHPILAFDSTFDVILRGSSVWILNQKNFEALFKESEAVLSQTSEWVEKLGHNLPITADSKAWLIRG